jgi:hypothetical protein
MFVEHFKTPYNESVEWDRTIGIPETARLGLCGKNIEGSGTAFERRLDSLKNLGFLTEEDGRYLGQVYTSKFCDKICIKESGHSGACQSTPYGARNTVNDKINTGINQKITDPFSNPGGDPNPLQNRGGSRNGLIQLDNSTEKAIRQRNKNIGIKKENTNLGIRLAMGSSKYMMALAYIDMYAMVMRVPSIEEYLNPPAAFKSILDTRWQELKEYYQNKGLFIYTTDDHLQDPILHSPIQLEQFGQGHTDLMGIQFGHVEPISEERWMTRPFNVLPLTRKTNLIQSNDSLYNVLDNMRQCISNQDSRLAQSSVDSN